MKKPVLSDGIIWLILGIGMCIESINLNLGKLNKPGPGFMPFLSGTFLSLLGLVLILYFKGKGGENEKLKAKETVLTENCRKVILTLLTLFGYTFLLEILGFFLTSILFLFTLFEITQGKRWVVHFIFAGLTVFLSYVIFSMWLMVHFPKGILRF